MKKVILLAAAAAMLTGTASAQRVMDKLDRGLVAVSANSGMFVSWRVFGEDADNVKFNLYRDGSLVNSQPLSVSNFTDAAGSPSSKYTVKTVVNGVEKESSAASLNSATDYLEIKIAPIPSNIDGSDIKADYEPNDATVADLDGDGQLEILMKLRNNKDHAASDKTKSKDFDIIQVYKLDGTLLWWIDMGPNMLDFQSNEINIAAYDWDLDGKAECVLRAADGTVIHMADGTTQVIGDPTKNERNRLGYGGGGYFTTSGAEYLLYLNGETGKPYYVGEYPLKRLEAGETDLSIAWGDGYGHRSSKHFYGAPYLDGRKPSIFMARGIYTRHKMVAFDVDPATHQLVERWRWNMTKSGSPWYGQGYHNYCVADVDWDGRDEIVFGSMVIDDNGRGLSTTGLGHGDSQHCGDFNPYIFGQEIVACNEDSPNNNYRDATTSKIYYRTTGSDDDGRCIAGNFTNNIPGAQFTSARDYTNLISTVSNAPVKGTGSNGVAQNFRIFWDGDLLDETMNYDSFNGTTRTGTPSIQKYGQGIIRKFDGAATNNDTKGTPCFQGDILGDWREELIVRSADNTAIRIYTTTIPTEYRIYTLLDDPQYRNAMVWQMNGYNQTPHPSFFLGELEGITQAPPAPTMNGREEVDGSVSASFNGKAAIFAKTGNATASVSEGAAPAVFIDNAPSWVQGNDDNDNITYEYFTHTLTGGAFAGDMKLVKLGAGTLQLPAVAQKYTGDTEVWLGTLDFNGELQQSRLVLNRHSKLVSDGGKFSKGIEMYYGAAICPGTDSKAGVVTVTDLNMGFGSKLSLDLFADGTADKVNAATLTLEKKDWEICPQYNAPVISFTRHLASDETKLPAGTYELGTIGTLNGNLSDVIVEGLGGQKANLAMNDGKLVLEVSDVRDASDVIWVGNTADLDLNSANFKLASSGEATEFVGGDCIIFDDSALSTDINLPADIYPAKIVFNNTEKQYTFSGAGFLGNLDIEKNGAGRVILNNTSDFTGTVTINGGTIEVAKLGANEGSAIGALGNFANPIAINGGGVLAVSEAGKMSHNVTVSDGGICVMKGTVTLVGASILGNGTFHKTGAGQLNLTNANTINTMSIDEGKVYDEGDSHQLGKTIIFNGTNVELEHNLSIYGGRTDNVNFEVPEGKSGKFLATGRCDYTGKLTGKGKLEVVLRWVRNYLKGDWSEFEGTLVASQRKDSNYDPSYDYQNSKGLPKATLQIASGCTFNNGNLELGALEGTGVLGGSGTTKVGGKNVNSTFSGTIANGVSLVKNGEAKLTISKSHPNMGSITVNSGNLTVKTGNTQAALGQKAMVVKGVLAGAAVYGNSSATFGEGGVLNPSSTAKSDKNRTITFNNSLTMEPGSCILLEVLATDKYSKVVVDGQLALNSSRMYVQLSNYKPKLGDEFTFWTAGEADAFDFKQIELPELPSGFYWDTTAATHTNGLVKVTDQPGLNNFSGIKDIAADAVVVCRVVNLSGVVVKEFTATASEAKAACADLAPGVYIVAMMADGVSQVEKIVVD